MSGAPAGVLPYVLAATAAGLLAEESLLSTAMLFTGFLVVLALKLTHHH